MCFDLQLTVSKRKRKPAYYHDTEKEKCKAFKSVLTPSFLCATASKGKGMFGWNTSKEMICKIISQREREREVGGGNF